ncbi:VOC family protein [Methyloceanibacter sp.]|uniref:VOC family protein n=1 Tax=Methyloceanibacter sp. TaxID=1965321 RepID=UPI003D6CFAB2
MNAIRHMANCTNNNRRLARFYRLIFGMQEVWNEEQNSPYAFYVTDGYFNLNCLQIHQTMAEKKRNVGINHFGFQIDNLKEIEKKLGELDPPIRLAQRPNDGRYTEVRIQDPDGNGVDLAEKGWGTGNEKNLPGVRYVGITTQDPARLAEFYKFIFGMKEIGRNESGETGAPELRLSDGTISLGLIKSLPAAGLGLHVLGFQVPDIQAVEEQLKKPLALTYKNEAPLQLAKTEGVAKSSHLMDPDGTYISLSEQGWDA